MRRWIRLWLSRRQEENDLAEELRAHLAIESQLRVDAGTSPDEAARAAQRAFGNATRIQEDVRESWGWAGAQRFGEDVRIGLCMLRKTPLWTAVICTTLALGVSLSTAIFSIVYCVLLQPLTYPNPDRLVALWPSAPKNGYARFNFSAALWLDWRKNSALLEDIALTRPIANFNLTRDGEPERLQGARTSSNLPAVLQVRPMLGRTFTEGEAKRGCESRGPEPCVLAAKVRWRPRDLRAENSTQWRALRSDRRNAARVPLSECGLRVVDPFVHSPGRDSPWHEQPVHCRRPTEDWRQPGAGTGRIFRDDASARRGISRQVSSRQRLGRGAGGVPGTERCLSGAQRVTSAAHLPVAASAILEVHFFARSWRSLIDRRLLDLRRGLAEDDPTAQQSEHDGGESTMHVPSLEID